MANLNDFTPRPANRDELERQRRTFLEFGNGHRVGRLESIDGDEATFSTEDGRHEHRYTVQAIFRMIDGGARFTIDC